MSEHEIIATDPKAVERRLRELAASGRIAPEDVVEDARDESSPLHAEFEWDDAVAAHAQRLERARFLIRSVKVVVTTTEHTVRFKPIPAARIAEFVRDPVQPRTVAGYVSVEHVRKQEQEQEARILADELDRVVHAIARALGYFERFEREAPEVLHEALEELRRMVEKLRNE